MKVPALYLSPESIEELRQVVQQSRNTVAMRRRHREQEARVAELNRDIRQVGIMQDSNPIFGADFGNDK